MAHKHLKWGYDASLRGSVKNFILRKEAEVMPRTALVNAIRVKNQELTAVQHVQAQGPGIAAPRSEEIRYWWNAPDFSREMYGIDLEHFTTIRQSGQHLGLTKYEIHCYLKSGASVSERGTIQLFALKTKVKKLTPAGKAGEIHRLQMELEVLEEILEKGVVVLW